MADPVITKNSPVSIGLAIVVIGGMFIFGASAFKWSQTDSAWKQADAVWKTNIENDVKALKKETEDPWTRKGMANWANQLKELNPELKVPSIPAAD